MSTIPGAIPRDWVVEGFSPEGPEDPPPRRLVLHDHRGRRHRRAADRAHGHRRALAIDPRAVGELSRQPARPHDQRAASAGGRAAMPRWSRGRRATGGRSITATRRLIWTLGRQTLLDRVEWTAGRLVPDDRRRPVAAAARAPRRAGGAARAWRCRTISRAARAWARDGASSAPRPDEATRVARADAHAAPDRARHRAGRFVAAAADRGRPRLPVRMRRRDRPRHHRRARPVLRRQALLRARLRRDALRHPSIWPGARPPRQPARAADAAARHQRPPHRHLRHQRRRRPDAGRASTAAWRCRATTTMSAAAS